MTDMSIEEYRSSGEKHRSKYRNIRTVIDGIDFMSKREANYYATLKIRERAGEIKNIRRQVPFILQDKFLYSGEIVLPIKYLADFVIDEKTANGWIMDVVIDVKASSKFSDDVYKLKKKMLLFKYRDIIFREVYS